MEIPCPNCKQVLNVPENLLGKKIRCSACQSIVEVEVEVEVEAKKPTPPEAKKKTPSDSDNPFALGEESSPASDFAFDVPTDQINVGLKLKMQAAANMMMYGLGYAVFVSLVLSVPPIFLTAVAFIQPQRPPLLELFLGLAQVWTPICCGYVVGFVFGIFIYLGVRSLRLLRARGRVITGAVFSILLGLQGFLGLVISLLAISSGVAFIVFISILLGFLSFVQVIFCIWGGIRALILISRQEVHEAILAEEARTRKAEVIR